MTERPIQPDDDAARSLRLAREVFSPSATARERVWAGLAVRAAGVAPAPGPAPPPAVKMRVAARRPAPSVLLAAGKSGLLVAAGFALGVWFSETRSAELAPPSAAQAGPAPAAPILPVAGAPLEQAELGPVLPSSAAVARAPAAPTHVPAPPARARASRQAKAARASASASSTQELVLLQRAERAIRAGDGELARSFIAELETRFAQTVWREEREAILVLAACVLAEPGAAENARSFSLRHPGSVYFDRIGSSCQLDTDGPRGGGH